MLPLPEDQPIYGYHVIMMLLVVHLTIGPRRLRDMDAYRDDGMVKRIFDLERLTDVSTVSCFLADADDKVSARCGMNRDVRSWSSWHTRGFRG